MLRGAADAAGQTGRATGTTGRQQGRTSNALRNALNNFGRFNSMYNQRRQIRIPISLGFSPTTLPTSPVVGARVQDRLTRIPQLRDSGPITVEMEGRVAVLRGGVVSSHERELAARLVLLEPGISGVRNELQVTQTEATP
jgi:osmotically-inducible protein OsmY